jgi:hypothetical protein
LWTGRWVLWLPRDLVLYLCLIITVCVEEVYFLPRWGPTGNWRWRWRRSWSALMITVVTAAAKKVNDHTLLRVLLCHTA